MAAFKTQVDDLTGFANTDDTALSSWLTDGAQEVISILPPQLKQKCLIVTFIDNSLNDIDALGQIISVTRNDADSSGTHQLCREIPVWAHSRAEDSSDLLYYGTASDPIYYTFNNVLKVFPIPTKAQNAHVHHIKKPSVIYSDSTIINFPNEAEHLVVLYASIRAVESLMATEEDVELYIPMLSNLRNDYVQGISAIKFGGVQMEAQSPERPESITQRDIWKSRTGASEE